MTSTTISTVSTTSSLSNNPRTSHQGMSYGYIPDVLAQQVFIFLNPLEFIQIRTVSLNWHRLTLNPLAIRSQLQVCDVHLESARAIQTMTHLSSVTEETWKKLA